MESQVQGSAGISVVILLGPVWAPVPDPLPCVPREHCPKYQYCLWSTGHEPTVTCGQNFRSEYGIILNTIKYHIANY
jgi:hypothetical protein